MEHQVDIEVQIKKPAYITAAEAAQNGIREMLRFIGEDEHREGLRDTPARVIRAFREMTAGYEQDPAEILATTFEEPGDQIVMLGGIEFVSLCEHHLLPFTGEAIVGYLPDGKVVGLSKLARLVECFSRRLQIQERMTQEIGAAVQQFLEPRGVGVVVKAHHHCMSCRGVRQANSVMTTMAMFGHLRAIPEVRAEFMRLIT